MRRRAGVHQHEAAGAIGVFDVSRLQAGLSEQSRVLIAQCAGKRHAVERRGAGAVNLAGGADVGQTGAWNIEQLQQFVVPLQRRQIHQLRARGIGHIGDVTSAFWTTREIPDQPAVDCAKERVAALRHLPRARHIFEQPGKFRGREIGGGRQTGAGAKQIADALRREPVDQRFGARVHPHQRRMQWRAGCAVPQHRCFALIGDADGGEISRRQASFCQRAVDNGLCIGPDFGGVMLNPAGLRVNLAMFALVEGAQRPCVLKDQETRAGRALIDGANQSRHGSALDGMARKKPPAGAGALSLSAREERLV